MADPNLMPSADPAAQYDAAVSKRDPAMLYQLAQQTVGTPISEAAANSAKTIVDNQKKFQDYTLPIEKEGGVGTPKGNMAFMDQWKTVADNPKWGTALLKWALGDKEGAAKQITGGDITQKMSYDINGKRLLERTNALGETVSVVDMETGQPVMKAEYSQRVAGIPSWEQTLESKSREKNQTANLEALKKSQTVNNAWDAKLAAHAPLYKQIYDNLGMIKADLPPDQYAKVFQFASNSMGQASSQSKNTSLLKNLQSGAGFRAGEAVSKELQSSLGLPGGAWTFNGKGGITNEKGETKSFSELEQNQKTENLSSENNKQFAQTQKDVMTFAKLQGLSDEATNRIMRTLELSRQIGQDNLEMNDKYGKPLFLSMPGAFSIMDKQAQGRAQALQGMFNSEAMQAYRDYYNKAQKDHQATKTIPNPNEMESGFVNSPEYKRLEDKYAPLLENTYKEQFIKTEPVKQATKPGAVKPPGQPPAVVNQGSNKGPAVVKKKTLADLAKQFGG